MNRYRSPASSVDHLDAALELVFATLCVAIVIVLARKRMWPEFIYVGLSSASLLTSSFYESVPRSTVIAFPLFLLVGQYLAERDRWQTVVLAMISTALLTVNVTLFVRGYSAG